VSGMEQPGHKLRAAAAAAQKSVGDGAPGTQTMDGGGGTSKLRWGAQQRRRVSSWVRGELAVAG
jgi:hypothetical protein